MYKKNIALTILELTFKSPPIVLPSNLDPGRPSPRVVQLYLFIEQNVLQRSTFDDIKEYISDLTFDEAKYFVDNFSKITSGNVSLTMFPLIGIKLIWITECRTQMSKDNSSPVFSRSSLDTS